MIKQITSLKPFSNKEIFSWYERFIQFKETGIKPSSDYINKQCCLFFFEPSSRTSLSFETALKRLNISFSKFVADENSSLSKGETLEDTYSLITSMDFDFYIGRTPATLKNVGEGQTYLSAGHGSSYHPTQALLDLFTMFERHNIKKFEDLDTIKGKNILYVGDTKYSRVFRSHLELLPKFGFSLQQVGQAEQQAQIEGLKKFERLDEAYASSDVIYVLRTQWERHKGGTKSNKKNLTDAHPFTVTKDYSFEGKVLMHPGPFIRNVDFDEELLDNSNCLIWSQVQNGVYTRAALIDCFLESRA